MKLKNNYYYTLLTPLMILIAFLGFTFRDSNKKNFYLPIGIVGIYLVFDKEYNRKKKREDIFNKIKTFSKNK